MAQITLKPLTFYDENKLAMTMIVHVILFR